MSDSFLQLVFAMRQAQKLYFKERTQGALKESKRLEKDVDARLEFLMVQRGIHAATLEQLTFKD